MAPDPRTMLTQFLNEQIEDVEKRNRPILQRGVRFFRQEGGEPPKDVTDEILRINRRAIEGYKRAIALSETI